MAKGVRSSTGHAGGQSLGQAGIAEKSDGMAGFDPRDLFAEFDQPIRLHQRRQQARALARKFCRLKRAIRALAQAGTDIFAAGDFFL